MQRAPVASNEAERIEAVRETGVLDTAPESCFDRLTDLAARLCGAPIALITLVDVDRQWFKSHHGLDLCEMPRDVALCAHAILENDVLVVPDTLEDERFADNPLVTSDPRIRFYAGCPLLTRDGKALGTLCVIDSVPRALGPEQTEALRVLAAHATTLLELRRTKERLAAHSEQWERADDERDAWERAVALARLGQDLDELIEARERAETSFRALESGLEGVPPALPSRLPPGAAGAASAHDAIHEVDGILQAIAECSDRLVRQIDTEDPRRVDVVRIGVTARLGRKVFRESGLRGAPPRASS